MKTLCLLLFFWCAISYGKGFEEYVDQSESAFFPKAFGEKLTLYKSFPAFWWNFVIFEGRGGEEDFSFANALCKKLKDEAEISQVECEQDLGQYLPLVGDWSRDIVFRERFPQKIEEKFLSSLGKASLPIPKSVFQILRVDPLGTAEVLRDLMLRRLQLKLQRKKGFFYDEATRRFLLPIKLSFPPSESDRLQNFPEKLQVLCRESGQCAGVAIVGPHGSTLENKSQIGLDLRRVSLVGLGVFLISCASLIYMKKKRLALLFAPIGVSTGLSILVTVLVFGKIHGLTLSFGTSIIGLTVDYGLHAAFNKRSKFLWRSNFLGFATTVICLGVIYFTEIPLLKQIMFFSLCGFSFGYALLYLLRKSLMKAVMVEPYRIGFVTGPWRKAAVLVCVLGAGVGGLSLRPQFDLRQFNYQSSLSKEYSEWFYQQSFTVPPLFQVEEEKAQALTRAHEAKLWGESHGISYDSLANFLPTMEKQQENVATWQAIQCSPRNLETRLDGNTRKIFEPFLKFVRCSELNLLPLERSVPHYLEYLYSNGKWLSLWFPKNSAEVEAIKMRFPQALSLMELVSLFPRILGREMLIMFPLSLLFMLIVLYFYYRNWRYSFLGLLPFVCGVGFTVWIGLMFHLVFSFISLIALVMVLGLSVDYAIFAIDAFCCGEDEGGIHGRATGLVFAAVSTIAGFLPLIFCSHQVLSQLGIALTLGVIGTVVGTFWGIPALMKTRGIDA